MVDSQQDQDKIKEHIEEVEDDEEEDHIFNEKLNCRFYRKDFPEENDLVIVSFITNHHSSNNFNCVDPNH